jgi:hypothetical protein
MRKKLLIKVLKDAVGNLNGFWFEDNYLVCSDGKFLFWKEMDEKWEEPVFVGLDGTVGKVCYPAWKEVIPQEWAVEIELDWEFKRKFESFLKLFRSDLGYIKFEIENKELRVTKINLSGGGSFILEEPLILGNVLEESKKVEKIYLNLLYLKVLLEVMETPRILKLNDPFKAVLFEGVKENFLLMPMNIED